MDRRRKVRFGLFFIFNLLLILSPLIYVVISLEYFDDCEDCASIVRSASLEEAGKKGRLLKSYRTIRTKVINDSLVIKTASAMRFWQELVSIEPRNGKTIDDTMFVWSGQDRYGKIEFKVKVGHEFGPRLDSYSGWSSVGDLGDTIVIGLFRMEEVNRGTFVYAKTDNKKRK